MDGPRIGVTCGFGGVPGPYRAALEAAGATVVELSARTHGRVHGPALLDGLEGLLLAGGADVAPALYGEEQVHPTVRIEATRDAVEIPAVLAALAQDIPVFGICRGIQTLNVALGGTLWQDLPSVRPGPVVHRDPDPGRDRTERLHSVSVAEGTRLRALVNTDEIAVNSIHHQAVRDIAPGLRAAASSADGVIEALEGSTGAFVLAVQWHPEELAARDPQQAALFLAFAEAARRR